MPSDLKIFPERISFTPYIDGNVVNRDSNYDEKFWEMMETKCRKRDGLPDGTDPENRICHLHDHGLCALC